MKCNYKLVLHGMQTTKKMMKTMLIRWFLSIGSRVCQHTSPRWDKLQGCRWSSCYWWPTSHTLPHGVLTTSSSTWHGRTTCRPSRLTLLELLFMAPTGWAQYPSQILLRSFAQSSRGLHDGELATKPSWWWQPLRVTSTTGLQLDHLVPLDATLRCNALESHSLTIGSHSCKHKWVMIWYK
jgi:hypothetical protein